MATSCLYTPAGSGVTFDMLNDSGASPTKNYWAATGDNGSANGASGVTATISIPFGVFGVNTVWTMINFAGSGTSGLNDLTLTFNFGNSAGVTNGNTYQVTFKDGVEYGSTLVGGTHLGATYGVADINGVITQNAFSAGTAGNYTATLDYQKIGIPITFANQYIVNLQITDSGTSGVDRANISAITVQSPEPGTILMMLSGIGALGFARFRRRK